MLGGAGARLTGDLPTDRVRACDRSLLGVDRAAGVAIHYDSARGSNTKAAQAVLAHLQQCLDTPPLNWTAATVPQQANGAPPAALHMFAGYPIP